MGVTNGGDALRHQELRHDEEGARLAGAKGVAYDFHDYKAAGIERGAARRLGAARSAGRRCSTAPARPSASCPTSDKEGLDEKKALALMLDQPSMIKRPVLDVDGKLLVGFKPDYYAESMR